jgi:AraC family transcriptional regulator
VATGLIWEGRQVSLRRQGDQAMATIITPREVPKFVPGAVTAASDDLGWNGVWLRGYRYSALDVIVPPVRDFTIVSYCRGATFMEPAVRRRMDQDTLRARRCFAVD